MIFLLEANAPQANPVAALFPLIFIFAIFYFLLIRPQQRHQKEHRKMLEELRKNDSVVTTGGIHGVIQDVKDNSVLLKIDDNTKVLVDKVAIVRIEKRG
jgi:preprotein translocase subunit YajC